MITDAHLEQLLRDERDLFGEPDAALLDRPSVDVVDSPEPATASRAVASGRRRAARAARRGGARRGRTPERSGGAAGRRRRLLPSAPIPLHDQVVGTWQLEGIDTNAATYRDRPVVRFDNDGTWSGSDGCNGLGGTWRVADGGAFVASIRALRA